MRELSEYKLKELQDEQAIKRILVSKLVAKLVRDRMKNFVVPKRNQIFHVWREIASKRARYLRKLAATMAKSFRQHGFNSIVEADCRYRKLNDTQKKLHRLFRDYSRGRARLAFDIWQEHMFKRATGALAAAGESELHAAANSSIARE